MPRRTLSRRNYTTLRDAYRRDGASGASARVLNHLLAHGPIPRNHLPPSLVERVQSWASLGYWPRVRPPRSFNEKILRRKLYTNDARFTRFQDKWQARKIVASRLDRRLLPDVHAVTTTPADIPFADLPDRFVVKATHGSGMHVLVDDKASIDRANLIAQCENWMRRTHGVDRGEYWYANIPKRIMVEEYLDDPEFGVPPDLKFHVFDGRVAVVERIIDRFGETQNRLYDRDWNPLEVKYDFPLAPITPRPKRWDDMVGIVETLGTDWDYIRVDMYNPNDDRIVFGEFTFAPASGGGRFDPIQFDFTLGSCWESSRFPTSEQNASLMPMPRKTW